MKIEWIAHSCFHVVLTDGTSIVFDPFDDTIGYVRKSMEADIVLSSHDHFDHNNLDHLEGDFTFIHEPGSHEVGNVKITGFPTFHDHHEGAHRGPNIAFLVEAEGVRLLHMGDVGCIPGDGFFSAIGRVDVLFIPVGGKFTVDGAEAFEICRRIDPNIIVPMHYKTLFLNMDLASVYPFTDAAGRNFDRSHLGRSYFEISSDRLKKRSRIFVMENALD